MTRAVPWFGGLVALLLLRCEVDDSSEYVFAGRSGSAGASITSGGNAGASSGGTPSTNGGARTGGAGGGATTGGSDGGGPAAGGGAGAESGAEGGALASGGTMQGGTAGEPTTGGVASGEGGVAEGGAPASGGAAQGGGAGEPPAEGGTPASGGMAGSGGSPDAGAGGEAGAPVEACPADPPGILTTFENDLYTICPPWDGFWAYTLGMVNATVTPCPTPDEFCAIVPDSAGEGHGSVIGFYPAPDVYEQWLTLDLRQNTSQPFADAAGFSALRFSARTFEIGQVVELFVQAYTSDTVEIEGGGGGNGEPGGDCLEPGNDCGIPYMTSVDVFEDWTDVMIPFTAFVREAENNPIPFDPAHLLYLRFSLFDGTLPVDIDDVSFMNP